MMVWFLPVRVQTHQEAVPMGTAREKTKQPDLVQAGLFAKSRWRLRSGRCLLAPHIVKDFSLI